MEEINKYLESLGLLNFGTAIKSNEGWLLDINNSDDWGKICSVLQQNRDLIHSKDSQSVTSDGAFLSFTDDDYVLNLSADWVNNVYQLAIVEVK